MLQRRGFAEGHRAKIEPGSRDITRMHGLPQEAVYFYRIKLNRGYPKLIGVLQFFFGALAGVSAPNRPKKNAYFNEVFKWGHSMGSFVRVWKIIIRIDEPGLLKLRPGSLLKSNRFQLFKF